MSAQFQIKRSNNSQYYFVLIANNNEPILTATEMYTTKQNCENAISSVRINSQIDSRYERKGYPNYSFILKAGNGEALGKGETYLSEQGRENGIAAVKRDAPNAPIKDLT